MKIITITQARMGSTRLPGKVMKTILGKPVLIHDLERIKKMKTISGVVVATTTLQEDDLIVKITKNYDLSVGIFRGSVENVLDRYYKAAKMHKADVIVRITSDCPLIDSVISDSVVKTFLEKQCDYCCNNMPRTFPHGLDTEVFSFEALETAWELAETPREKEHVTPYIREHPEHFKLYSIKNNVNLSDLRWTLDYLEDFEFIDIVYQKIYPIKPDFLMKDILGLLQKEPELNDINRNKRQKN